MPDIPALISAVCVLLAPCLAIAVLAQAGILVFRGDGAAARRFLGASLGAGLPVILTLASLVAAFVVLDPLWPAQDETPAMHLAHVAARDRADLVYRWLGLANIAACLWSAGGVFRAWQASRREAA